MRKDFEGWPLMDDKEIARKDKDDIVAHVRTMLALFPQGLEEGVVVSNLAHDRSTPEAWRWGAWDWRYEVTNRALRACAEARWHLQDRGL